MDEFREWFLDFENVNVHQALDLGSYVSWKYSAKTLREDEAISALVREAARLRRLRSQWH